MYSSEPTLHDYLKVQSVLDALHASDQKLEVGRPGNEARQPHSVKFALCELTMNDSNYPRNIYFLHDHLYLNQSDKNIMLYSD